MGRVSAASGLASGPTSDANAGGATETARRRRARDRAHAQEHARSADAASEDGGLSDAEADDLPMAASAAPQRRRRRATLAEVLSQSVMGTEAWRQLRASDAEGEEEEDRGAGAVWYRPPGPTGYELLSGCESAAEATTPTMQRTDVAFAPRVRRAHPTRGTPVKAPATGEREARQQRASPPHHLRLWAAGRA